jgi:hypothetical protein
MIRTIVGWIRVVLPPAWAVTLFLVLWLFFLGLEQWVAWWWGVPGADIAQVRAGAVALGAAAYGVYRVLAFHPLFRPGYASWLAVTPWTSRKPLPVGPIHLVVQDLVLIALMMASCYGTPSNPFQVALAFLGTYLGALCVSFWGCGLVGVAYVIAFGLGLSVRLGGDPRMAVCAVAVLYVLAQVGIRRSLARFPWQVPEWWKAQGAARKAAREGMTLQLGWPFEVLRPKPPSESFALRDAVFVSLLAGWWLYAGASAIPDEEKRRAIVCIPLFYVTGGCVLGRLLVYCRYYAPPISFWGRVFTLRWIVPGYDQVFAAPLCALVAAVAGTITLHLAGLPGDTAVPIAMSLVLFITLGMGPSMKSWCMTGNHRIAPTLLGKQQYVEL